MATASTQTANGDKVIEKPSRAFLKRMYQNLKKAVGDAFSLEVWQAAIKNARGHAGGMATAARRKMPKATAELVAFERAFVADEPADDSIVHTGLMICFYLSDDAAAAIAIPNGEMPED